MGVLRVATPWTRQPQYACRIDRDASINKDLIVAVSPAFRGNAVTGAIASAAPTLLATRNGRAYDTVTSGITIPSVAIPAGSDVTALFLVENYTGAGSNFGLWRGGAASGDATFFIVNGSTNYPWIRWSGGDVLVPGSGGAFAAGGNYCIIFRVGSGATSDCWVNGEQRFTGSAPGATPATSIVNLGWQSATTQRLGALALVKFWKRKLTDAECVSESANPWLSFAP